MVHTMQKKESILGKIKEKEIKISRGLIEELKKDRDWMNKYFRKLPPTLQYALAYPKDIVETKRLKYPFTPIGEEAVEKKRYGLIGIHNKHIYLGSLEPVGKEKAKVILREVFP